MFARNGPANGQPERREVRVPLGRVCATPGALESIDRESLNAALRRHASGDWGELGPEDKTANDDALQHGARILSAHVSLSGTKFWIITEADRSLTTVLLPSEY